MLESDQALAVLARQLAHALMDFAYTRKDEDKKRVHDLQAELCQRVRREQEHV